MTTDEALSILSPYAAYHWLTRTDAPTVWTVTLVVEAIMSNGFAIKDTAVRGWCRSGEIEGVADFGGQIGYRIPREGLLKFFAGRMIRGNVIDQAINT